jgi:hypothetical protein
MTHPMIKSVTFTPALKMLSSVSFTFRKSEDAAKYALSIQAAKKDLESHTILPRFRNGKVDGYRLQLKYKPENDQLLRYVGRNPPKPDWLLYPEMVLGPALAK